MKAVITIFDKELTLDISDERNLRNCIDRGVIYEYIADGKRTIINTRNISHIVLDTPKSMGILPTAPTVEIPTAAEIRKRQEAMQPDVFKFEAKAKAMADLKAEEDSKKEAIMSGVAKIVSGKP